MKRKRKSHAPIRASKRQNTVKDVNSFPTKPLLLQYYPHVLTLRQYLSLKLSKSSKKRQKRLLDYGLADGSNHGLVGLLDNIVIGTFNDTQLAEPVSIDKDLPLFTQQLTESTTTITPNRGAMKQSEIVDFVIWLLFRRYQGSYSPPHILCRGYQKHASGAKNGADLEPVPGTPGVFCNTRNRQVDTLKSHPWCDLPDLLGSGVENIISDMLMQCGIFCPVEGSSNLVQLSGVPLSDLKPIKTLQPTCLRHSDEGDWLTGPNDGKTTSKLIRGLSDIRFVRQRMLYARPELSGSGKAYANLSRNHILNSRQDPADESQTIHVLKYVFPRQFGLHNVFTSDVDPKDTAQPFKDYDSRDLEIARSIRQWREKKSKGQQLNDMSGPPVPKRLRGQALRLIGRLRKRHRTCSYTALLHHYCPGATKMDTSNSIANASSTAQVSAFCRAAVHKVFPGAIWGIREVGSHNKRIVMRNIDKFLRLRRYESMSLHDVVQNMRVHDIDWLAGENEQLSPKMSATDFTKRQELIAELLYYLFDSFLIPLLRCSFHVTESGVHRNQLFYFRQDVWKAMSEPALASLKTTMLEPCKTADVKRTLASRALGVSHVRLLPKGHGMRPIINLRRRTQKLQHGHLVLGKSINSILTPAFSVLNDEKSAHPEILGSALFSVEDMYPRLQAFRSILKQKGAFGRPLYFAKVDVKGCFDSIPQERLLQLVRSVLQANGYHITRYSRSKLIGGHNEETPGFGAKPSWRYLTRATADNRPLTFANDVEADIAEGRTRTVYIDGVIQKWEPRKAILELLAEHVQSNLIKLGNRFYRQKEGIPQGSIVSSLLCSFFYGELERKILGFVHDGESTLLRLIDDFLVISTNRAIAERFMREMHSGIPEFGVEVKAEKSRANFDIVINGRAIERLPQETEFPYCGNAINTVTLDLSKDKEGRKKSNIPDSMSVEYSKLPGQTFYRKTLNALKLHMQAMLLSTKYNSLATVLCNLHHSFTEVAQKSYHYIRSLPAAKQPSSTLVIRAVDDLIKLACVLMKRRKRTSKDVLPYECCVSNAQTRWLACTACHTVFLRRQTKHRMLMRWLEGQLALPGIEAQRRQLQAVLCT